MDLTDTSSPKPLDVRIQHTRDSIERAFHELLKSHKPEELTISQLCAAAKVSRPTFYQHYGTVEDVMIATVLNQLEQLAQQLQQSGESNLSRLMNFIGAHYEEFQETLELSSSQARVREVVADWIRQQVATSVYQKSFANLDAESRLRVIFVVAGLTATMTDYLFESKQQPVETLAPSIQKLVSAILPVGGHHSENDVT